MNPCKLGLLLCALGVACGSRDSASRPRDPAPASPAADIRDDGRVDANARAACLVGDSLLRAGPKTAVQSSPTVPSDSVWYSETPRWFCRVMAEGNSKNGWLSVDTIMRGYVARGWSDRTMISADGPDGTVVGLYRSGVTCVVEGRWDGGDDSDTTYVPSDTMEVRVSCGRTLVSDTLMPDLKPSTIPARPLTGTIVRP